MSPRLIPLCRVVLASLGLMATGMRGWAQLAASSPFLPPQTGGATPTANAPLEYRGFMEIPDEGIRYRIVDPARKTSAWVKLNEKNADFPGMVVKQYDGDHRTLTVENDGRVLTLPERESKIVSSGSAAQMVMPPPQPGMPMPNAVTQTVAINPTPAQEQQRLEAVAAEVARRRALREQAAQQNNPGGMPPSSMGPVPIQTQPPPTRVGPVPTPQNMQDGARRGQNVNRQAPR